MNDDPGAAEQDGHRDPRRPLVQRDLPEIVIAGLAAREGQGGISVGAILGSNITDPVFSLGLGAVLFDVVVTTVAALTPALTYMFVVSVLASGLFYWRRRIDRPAAVVCLLLYAPAFVLL